MSALTAIRATARFSDWLYRYAPPVYTALYDAYKRRSERHCIALIRRCVPPGGRAVDVGANIGFYTEVLATCVGATGSVYAFEPDPRNFACLSARVRAYPQVTPVQAAVTDAPGSIDLYQSPHLNIDHRTYATDEPRTRSTVRAVSLDRGLPAHVEAVDFIKMDIQGAEYPALVGMREIVQRSPRVRLLLELWPFVYERYGAGTNAILTLLDAWGFDVHRLGAGETLLGPRLVVGAPVPERDDPDAYFDVLCVRRGGPPL